MDLAMEVFAGSFGYALGDRKADLTESAAAGLLTSDPADLAAAGFRWHHVCEASTTSYDLARAAVADTGLLGPAGDARDGGDAGVADAIVYATCLPANANAGDPAAFEAGGDVKHLMDFPAGRLQADLGLAGAPVFGLDQQACTGMLGALRLAAALLATEPGWRRVLCVTADRFPAGARYEQAYNLISDGAAACVVGREPAALRLLTVHQITNGGLGRAGDDETVGAFFAYTHRLVRETLERAGLAAGDLDWIVPQNTHEAAWRILAGLLGVDHARVWSPSLPDVGHVISADAVVNLCALLESGRLRPGQRIALVMAGFGLTWQCAVFEVTQHPASGAYVQEVVA